MSNVVQKKSDFYKQVIFLFVAVVPTFIAVAIFQIFRLWPALPTVLQDEYVYSVGAKYGGVEEAARFGNFLYYELYGFTSSCGAEFYACARAINGVWYVGLLLVLFAYAIRYLSKTLSLFLIAAIGLGPFGLYVSLFMPEMMFFFFASLGLLLFTIYWESGHSKNHLIILALSFGSIGIGSLVKPHAVFLAFGLLSLVLLKGIFSSRQQILTALREMFLGVVVFFLVKLSIGYMLAGNAGLTLFGRSYTGALVDFFSDLQGDSNKETKSDTLGTLNLETVEFESESIVGHLDVLFIHFGLLLLVGVMILGPLVGPLVLRGTGLWKDPLTVLGSQFIIIGAIVSVFAAHVTAQGDDHSERLLFRYFEYLVPFLLILGIHKARQYQLQGWKKYVALFFSVLSIIVIFTNIEERKWGIVDSVFLYSIFSSQDSQWLWAAAIAIVTYLIYVPTKFRTFGPLAVLVAAIGVVGQMGISNQLKINGTKIASDYAGEYVYENFPEVQGEDILVLGSNRKLVEAAMFAMDKPDIDFELLPEGSVLAAEAVSNQYKLVVETTGVFLSRDDGKLFTGEGFAITIFE